MSGKRRVKLFLLSVSGIFVGFLVLFAFQSIRQDRLNMDLRFAVANGDALQVKTLLSRGADPNCGSFGDAKIAQRKSLIGKVMLRFERKPTPASLSMPLVCSSVVSHHFHVINAHAYASARNVQDIDVLKALLDAGADVNAAETGGFTALIRAVQGGDTEAVRVLLNHGAKLEAKDFTGRTALKWAADPDIRKQYSRVTLNGITTLLQQ